MNIASSSSIDVTATDPAVGLVGGTPEEDGPGKGAAAGARGRGRGRGRGLAGSEDIVEKQR